MQTHSESSLSELPGSTRGHDGQNVESGEKRKEKTKTNLSPLFLSFLQYCTDFSSVFLEFALF
jgi:hypothetical protein